MKKIIISCLVVGVIGIIAFSVWYNKNLQTLNDIKKFNNEYADFLDKEINGDALATVINKAIENNNNFNIEKNKDGTYKNDNKSSIEIVIRLTDDGKEYPMEAFEKVGIKEFTGGFGSSTFKSIETKYHKNGRISKITFEIIKN